MCVCVYIYNNRPAIHVDRVGSKTSAARLVSFHDMYNQMKN